MPLPPVSAAVPAIVVKAAKNELFAGLVIVTVGGVVSGGGGSVPVMT